MRRKREWWIYNNGLTVLQGCVAERPIIGSAAAAAGARAWKMEAACRRTSILNTWLRSLSASFSPSTPATGISMPAQSILAPRRR